MQKPLTFDDHCSKRRGFVGRHFTDPEAIHCAPCHRYSLSVCAYTSALEVNVSTKPFNFRYTSRTFCLCSCTTTIKKISPLSGPRSSLGYGNSHPLRCYSESSSTYASQAWSGSVNSYTLFASSEGKWPLAHFHDTVHAFVLRSSVTLKSGSSIEIAAYLFMFPKRTSPDSVRCTASSHLIASIPRRRSNPSNRPSTTSTIRERSCSRPNLILPYPRLILPHPSASNSDTGFCPPASVSIMNLPEPCTVVHWQTLSQKAISGFSLAREEAWRWRLLSFGVSLPF